MARAGGRKRANGDGSITKLDSGKYRAMWTIPDTEGKRKSKVFDKYGEAREWLDSLIQNSKKGMLPPADGKLTVAKHMEHWLEHSVMPSNLARRTKRAYDGASRLYIVPSLGNVKLSELRAPHLRKMYADMTARGLEKSIKNAHAVLHTAIEQAVSDGLIHTNACRDFFKRNKGARPRAESYTGTALSEEQIWKLLETAEDTRWHGLLTMAVFTQCRIGELLGLRWTDVDLEAKVLWVRQQLDTETKNFSRPKSEAGRRSMSLPQICVDALRLHRARQIEERLVAGSEWRSDLDLIFCTGKAGKSKTTSTNPGSPLTQSCVRRSLNKLLEAASLPQIRIHDLRHSGCTLLASQPGVTAPVLMRRMGHTDIRLTLGRYNHVLNDHDREAADKLDAIVNRKKSA